ncbi:MAG: hypothetical protein ABIR91_05495 [Candidatus Saccharimonadales bacterium]
MKRKFIIAGIVLAVIGVAVWVSVFRDSTPLPVADSQQADSSVFSLDSSSATGWKQGVTNETSMAVFGGGDVGGCFIAVEYLPGQVDVSQALAAVYDQGNGGVTRTEVASQSLTLHTSGGDVSYALHQSNFTPAKGAEPVKAGFGVGFAQLRDHYVKLTTHCDKVSQRADTYAALKAVIVRQ